MTAPCLDDPKIFPSDAVLAAHLGGHIRLWETFAEMVERHPAGLALAWRFYRDGNRWLGKVGGKKKTVCWISIEPGWFKVTFYLGSKNDAAVAKARIAPALKRAFLASKGRTFRPLTVEVRKTSALDDVREVLALATGGGRPVRRPRGFVNYDLWLVATGLAMAAAIIVPAVYRGARKAHLRRAEITALGQIAAAERAHHDRYLAYLDSLPFALPDGTRLLRLRGDSAGWSAAIAGDSGRRTQVVCGVFEGPATLAPDTAVTAPGRVACW